MTKMRAGLLLALSAAPAAIGSARAQTLAYSSYGPGLSHYYYGPETVGTEASHPYYLPKRYIALAAEFEPSFDGSLDHVVIALGNLSGLNAATITLVSDDGSGRPRMKSVLDTMIAQDLPANDETMTRSTRVQSVLKPELSAGRHYWLVVTTAAYDGNIYWYQSNDIDQKVDYTADGGRTFSGYTSHQVAFSIWVTPSSMWVNPGH